MQIDLTNSAYAMNRYQAHLKGVHDSMDRLSFMPGVCLAIKKSVDVTGLVYGLEKIL